MTQDDVGTGASERNTVAAQVAELVGGRSAVIEVAAGSLDGHQPASVDAVVLTDLLGSEAAPEDTLRAAAVLLRDGGRLVVTAPHRAHGSVLLALLDGRREPAATGLGLDELLDLLEAAGLVAEEVRTTVADPLTAADGSEVVPAVPASIVEWVRTRPGTLDRDLVVAAVIGTRGDALRPRPAPAVPYADVRRRDRFTEALEREEQARHDLLVMRDHVIGLEAAVAAAQARESDARSRLRAANKRFRDYREAAEKGADLGSSSGATRPAGIRGALRRTADRDR